MPRRRQPPAHNLICRGIVNEHTGRRCGETYDERGVDGNVLDAARAAGWKIHRWPNGLLDAMWPACAKPDPTTAALCRDLERSTQ